MSHVVLSSAQLPAEVLDYQLSWSFGDAAETIVASRWYVRGAARLGALASSSNATSAVVRAVPFGSRSMICNLVTTSAGRTHERVIEMCGGMSQSAKRTAEIYIAGLGTAAQIHTEEDDDIMRVTSPALMPTPPAGQAYIFQDTTNGNALSVISSSRVVTVLPVRGSDGANGAPGVEGPAGTNGVDGARGPIGLTGNEVDQQLGPYSLPANTSVLTTIATWTPPDPTTWTPPGPSGDIECRFGFDLLSFSQSGASGPSGSACFQLEAKRVNGTWALVGAIESRGGTMAQTPPVPAGYAAAVVPSSSGLVDIQASAGTVTTGWRCDVYFGHPKVLSGTSNPTAPIASITAPATGTTATQNASRSVSVAFASGGSTITAIAVDYQAPGSSTWTQVGIAATPSSSPAVVACGTWADLGAASLRARVTNAIGTTTTSTVSVTVQASGVVVAPTGVITAPTEGFTVSANAVTTVLGTYSDGGATTTIHVFDGATDLGSATVGAGTWSFDWTPTVDASASLMARFTNSAGSTDSIVVHGTVSSTAATAPYVDFQAVTNGFAAQVGVAMGVGGLFRENGSTITALRLFAGSVDTGVTLAWAGSTGSWYGSYTPTTEGSLSLHVEATNAIGTTSSDTVTGTVAAAAPPAAPSVTLDYPSDAFSVASGTTVAAGGTLAANRSTITSVTLSKTTVAGTLDISTPGGFGQSDYWFSGTVWSVADVGPVSLTVTATNAVGSTSVTINGTVTAA